MGNLAEEDAEQRAATKLAHIAGPTRNLPWQKLFKGRVAPVCSKVFEHEKPFEEFIRLGKTSMTFSSPVGFFENVPVILVQDASRPPKNLLYNVLTIAVEVNKVQHFSSDFESGVYMVREISAFPLAPGKPCITERLFMDRSRERFKAKGWGCGNWRIWLALEDMDAERKKKKKVPVKAAVDQPNLLKRSSPEESKSISAISPGVSKRPRTISVCPVDYYNNFHASSMFVPPTPTFQSSFIQSHSLSPTRSPFCLPPLTPTWASATSTMPRPFQPLLSPVLRMFPQLVSFPSWYDQIKATIPRKV